MSKILIIEDEDAIADLEKDYLELSDFTVEIAGDGIEGEKKALEQDFDLIVLDLMLPGIDGYQVCREVRAESKIPIIMLSAKGEVFDKVLGLELGADDYMEKPFDSKELVARVKAVLRRCSHAKVPAPTSDTKVVEYPDLVISLNDYSVLYNGQYLDMPPKEIELLFFLASQPNQVFTREYFDGEKDYIIVFNFSKDSYQKYNIPVTHAGVYREVFNSDCTKYGGEGVCNTKNIQTTDSESSEAENLTIKLPALSILAFEYREFTQKELDAIFLKKKKAMIKFVEGEKNKIKEKLNADIEVLKKDAKERMKELDELLIPFNK